MKQTQSLASAISCLKGTSLPSVKLPAHSPRFYPTLYDLQKKLDHVKMVFDVGIIFNVLILVCDELDA
jgi:hypothetical protein